MNTRLQTAIEGEANIARFLARLLSPAYDELDSVNDVDTVLDNTMSLMHGPKKMNASIIRSINAKLGRSQYVAGDCISVGDIVFWSSLHKIGEANKQTGNVKKWLNRCSENEAFSTAVKLISAE